MIAKKKEDYLFREGAGRPFEITERKPELKTDAERNRQVLIDLEDLQKEGKGPVNFSRKAGRNVGSFVNPEEEEEGLEIE